MIGVTLRDSQWEVIPRLQAAMGYRGGEYAHQGRAHRAATLKHPAHSQVPTESQPEGLSARQ